MEWRACAILPTTTFAFFFDIPASKLQAIPPGTISHLQFVTRYRHLATGIMRLRVTTASVTFADLGTLKPEIARGFDQEAATVLIARHAMWRIGQDETVEIRQAIDRLLIRFCRLFGTYAKNDPVSFSLDGGFALLPQFLYHFRRSPFLATFNSSPDQTTYLRHSLLCEDVNSSLFMIQPTLVRFSVTEAPHPVMLDTNSIQPDCVLLLDTFFRVLVWHGATIAAWRGQGYQEKPEYANLKVTLEAPREEAQNLVSERFPTPSLVICDHDSSLARYLIARCNPSDTPGGAASGSGGDLSTDEPSLAKFLAKLKEAAVVNA
jgi:protein transport protein SEC23